MYFNSVVSQTRSRDVNVERPATPFTPLTRTLSLQGDDIEHKRLQVLDYFQQTYDLYESLFASLVGDDAWFKKAIPLRHPLIFYFGHTAAFFINKLLAGGWINQRLDPRIEAMVAIGVDEMSWDDLDESHYAWPSVAELRHYRAVVRERVSDFIRTMPMTLPIDWQSPAWVILMGIEHERIHLETSSVLIRQLPLAQVTPLPQWPICPLARHQRDQVPANTLLDVPGGRVRLGKEASDATYGWDNEYGQREVMLAPFQASRMLVSNAEFLDFVQAGGYLDSRWWSEEGWGWRQFTQALQPCFWVGGPDAELRLRLMCEEVPMPWDWPVEVNQLEAEAFCRWKAEQTGLSVQLPCEAEWYQLRQQLAVDQPDWPQAPGNINLEYWASSCPVDYFAQGDFFDVLGNVWQWSSSAIDGFDGFRIHPLYDDFSTPTFDGKHNLIKGGSWISTGNLAIRNARYAFRRHFFQHAGFRYVVSSHSETDSVNPYETDTLVAQYLDAHYGPEYFGVSNYGQALAQLASRYVPAGGKALDMGCSVGRTSLELARHCGEVDGVDFSARFIDVALTLVRQDRFRYAVPLEGELLEYREARLSPLDMGAEQLARVHFSQGDACNLKPKYQGYDLVLAANLIDRLREPKRFLLEIGKRMNTGGVLVISSPYTWLESFTSKGLWLGGIRENGEALGTYQALQRLLAAEFDELAPPQDLPFVIRETARKYQHSIAQVTVWRKRG
jgi:5-histidylcysteine sulfoxide synthase/putative 4-mercaptohistidine N1-methyltranferase